MDKEAEETRRQEEKRQAAMQEAESYLVTCEALAAEGLWQELKFERQGLERITGQHDMLPPEFCECADEPLHLIAVQT